MLCYVRRNEFLALKETTQGAELLASTTLTPSPTTCVPDSSALGGARFGSSTTQAGDMSCPPGTLGDGPMDRSLTPRTTAGQQQQQDCLNSYPTRLHEAAKPAVPSVVSSNSESVTTADTYAAPDHSYSHRDYTRKQSSQANPSPKAKTTAELLAEKIREQEATIANLRGQLDSAQGELAQLRERVCGQGVEWSEQCERLQRTNEARELLIVPQTLSVEVRVKQEVFED
ncbi:uncharacterized protein LOC144138691 [Haemaphysalis longicornis]